MADEFPQMINLLIDRATAVAADVATLRELLEKAGVFSHADFEQARSAILERWKSTHATMVADVDHMKFLAQLRELFDAVEPRTQK